MSVEELDLLGTAAETGAIQAAALGPLPADRFAVLARHAAYPGTRAYGAYLEGRLIGYCYGSHCRAGQWWFDQVSTALVAAGHGAWVRDAYAVTELHLLPAHQGKGYGFALLTRLLADQAGLHALLSTYDIESAARSLYRRLGFIDLVTDFRFDRTRQTFALMVAPLPLPVSANTSSDQRIATSGRARDIRHSTGEQA